MPGRHLLPARRGALAKVVVCGTQAAVVLIFGFLCVHELIPPPAYDFLFSEVPDDIIVALPVVLLILLSGLVVLLATFHFSGLPSGFSKLATNISAVALVAMLNIVSNYNFLLFFLQIVNMFFFASRFRSSSGL